MGDFIYNGKKLSVTYDDLVKTADNFRANVLGSGVPVDMPDHQPEPGGAYGWVADLEARQDGLYARFQWTERGVETFSKRLYRFISAWWGKLTTATGKTVDLVLKGVSPTNRPFFADAGTRIAASTQANTDADAPVSNPGDEPEIETGSNGAEEVQTMDENKTIEPTPVEPEVQLAHEPVQETAAPAGSDGDTKFAEIAAKMAASLDAKYAAEVAGLKATVKVLTEKQTKTEGEMLFARVENEVSGWKFAMPGGGDAVFSPHARTLFARVLIAVDEELGTGLRTVLADEKAFANMLVPMGELSANVEPKQDAEVDADAEFNALRPETREEIMAIAARDSISREAAEQVYYEETYLVF